MSVETLSPPLSIQKTYTRLENIVIPRNLYVTKYEYSAIDKEKISLEDSKKFLNDIKAELKKFKSANLTLSEEYIAALFKLETNTAALNTLVDKLASKEEVTLSLLYCQLAEFIDLSRLSHFISITPISRFDQLKYAAFAFANSMYLEEFAALTQLKFRVFQANLYSFLEVTQEKNASLEEIVSTLISDYLAEVAKANYPTAFYFTQKKYGINYEALRKAITDREIPLLEGAFKNYQARTAIKKLSEIPKQYLAASEDEAADNICFYSCDEGYCESIPDSEDESDKLNEANVKQAPTSHKKATSLLNWLKSLPLIKCLIKLFKKTENHPAPIHPKNTTPHHSDESASTPIHNVIPSSSNATTSTVVDNTIPDWRKKQGPETINYPSNRYRFHKESKQPDTLTPVIPRHWKIYMRFM
jgi:hypothetical protein